MFALKIPLAGLIYIVWWAIKQEPDEASSRDDDGGIKRQPPHPRKPFPRHPRRGWRGNGLRGCAGLRLIPPSSSREDVSSGSCLIAHQTM